MQHSKHKFQLSWFLSGSQCSEHSHQCMDRVGARSKNICESQPGLSTPSTGCGKQPTSTHRSFTSWSATRWDLPDSYDAMVCSIGDHKSIMDGSSWKSPQTSTKHIDYEQTNFARASKVSKRQINKPRKSKDSNHSCGIHSNEQNTLEEENQNWGMQLLDECPWFHMIALSQSGCKKDVSNWIKHKMEDMI